MLSVRWGVASLLALTMLLLAPAEADAKGRGGGKGKNAPGLAVGKKAPAWAGLRDRNGRLLSPRQFQANKFRKTQGKVVLLSFFATWCEPCKKELPMLLDFKKKYADKGVELLMVGFREKDDLLAKFIQERKIEGAIVANDRYGKTAERYGVNALPRLFIIGRDGKLLGKIEGEHDDLDQQLEKMLAKELG